MQRRRQRRKSDPMTYEFRVNPQDANLLLSMSYLLLASNSFVTIFRIYSSGQNSLLAFAFFMCSGFFLLECCFSAYLRLPQRDKSARKKFLSVAIWCLFTGIVFGVTYQFSPLFSFAGAAVFFYAVAFAASAFIFYVYIIHDDVEECCNNNCCNNANNDSIGFSGGNLEIIFDKV